MKIYLNGKTMEVENEVLLIDLINEKSLNPDRIVVEYNFNIVKRDIWKDIRLKEGDRIEVLSFVGGG